MANTFDDKFIQAQKKKLIEFKNQILNSMKNTQVENLRISPEESSEDGDLAQVVISQGVSFGLREREIKRLREIDVALRKIDEGTYGFCEVSDEAIEKKRLEKMPWARLSLEAAEEIERIQGFRAAI